MNFAHCFSPSNNLLQLQCSAIVRLWNKALRNQAQIIHEVAAHFRTQTKIWTINFVCSCFIACKSTVWYTWIPIGFIKFANLPFLISYYLHRGADKKPRKQRRKATKKHSSFDAMRSVFVDLLAWYSWAPRFLCSTVIKLKIISIHLGTQTRKKIIMLETKRRKQNPNLKLAFPFTMNKLA